MRRGTRQQRDADFTDTHGSLKTTKHSHSKRSHMKGKNSPVLANAHNSLTPAEKDGRRRRSSETYDAVILHSGQDGVTALKVKQWLEQNLILPFCDDHRHPPKIELMGNIDPNYVTSLEIASKHTKTIIILCTKRFDYDVLFKNTVNALWTFKSVQDFQIVPLLFDFGAEESPPESIPVIDGHILRFETECEYFKHTMKTRLSHTRLQHEKTRGNQHGRREGKDGLEQRPLRPSAGTSNDDGSHPTTRHQSYEDEPEATLPHETDVCDSGVGYSVPSAISDNWSLQSQTSSSGPPGLPHSPCVNSTPTVSSSPGVEGSPQNPSASIAGAFGSSLLAESSTNIPTLQSGNDCEETRRDEDERTETKSEADKEQRARKALPVSSTTVPKKEINSEIWERDGASHTEESGARTTRPSSGQLTSPSVSAEHQQYLNCPSYATMSAPDHFQRVVNPSRAPNGTSLEENSDPKTSSQNQGTDLVPDSCLDVGQNHRVKSGKSYPTTGKDVQRNGHMLSDCGPTSVTQSQMTSDGEGYLTPCNCINHCDDCRKSNEPEGLDEQPSCYHSLESEDGNPPDTVTFLSDKTRLRVSVDPAKSRVAECRAENAQKRQPGMKTERLTNLSGAPPATMRPPIHSYVNAPPDHSAVRSRLSPSCMVLPPERNISTCNQSPTEYEEVAEAAVVV